jgi:hypothetical protein
VIRAEMKQGHMSPLEIAAGQESAGLLFDPQRAEQIATAAREQGAAESRAEIEDLRERLGSMEHFKAQLDGVRSVLAGRPHHDMMSVSEILAAADGKNPREDVPLLLTWDHSIDVPYGGTGEARVRCTTGLGASAVLTLDLGERLALASVLDAEVRDIHAKCPAAGCGTQEDLDESDPALWGWSRLQVAGNEGPARWYCSPVCVSDAMARAGAELAAADRAADAEAAEVEDGGGACDCHGAWHFVRQHCRDWPCPDCERICTPEPGFESESTQAAAVDPHAQAPDPLAYGPTGYRCGCGKEAHSNLVPCQPDTHPTDAGSAL